MRHHASRHFEAKSACYHLALVLRLIILFDSRPLFGYQSVFLMQLEKDPRRHAGFNDSARTLTVDDCQNQARTVLDISNLTREDQLILIQSSWT
jgi:hypothetical protein